MVLYFFGMILIDWTPKDPKVTLQIIDVDNKVQVEHGIGLAEISKF